MTKKELEKISEIIKTTKGLDKSVIEDLVNKIMKSKL